MDDGSSQDRYFKQVKLQDLVERMRQQTGQEDAECEHATADAILCEAVKMLEHPLADELLRLYAEVGKWYA